MWMRICSRSSWPESCLQRNRAEHLLLCPGYCRRRSVDLPRRVVRSMHLVSKTAARLSEVRAGIADQPAVDLAGEGIALEPVSLRRIAVELEPGGIPHFGPRLLRRDRNVDDAVGG